jgi:hypothetical protein
MGRETTERVALRPETKSLLENKKPDGVDYDFYIRHAVKHAPPVGDEQ